MKINRDFTSLLLRSFHLVYFVRSFVHSFHLFFSFFFFVISCECVYRELNEEAQKERKKKNYAVYLDTFRVLEFNETFSLQIP